MVRLQLIELTLSFSLSRYWLKVACLIGIVFGQFFTVRPRVGEYHSTTFAFYDPEFTGQIIVEVSTNQK